MKWFNDLKEKHEQTIQQATKDYHRGIYLYLQEKLTPEEFDWLKDYAGRHGKNFRGSTNLISASAPKTLQTPEDYEEIESILDLLSENLQGKISPDLNSNETRLAESILGKLGYKKCWKCGKWFEPEDGYNFCPTCRKKP